MLLLIKESRILANESIFAINAIANNEAKAQKIINLVIGLITRMLNGFEITIDSFEILQLSMSYLSHKPRHAEVPNNPQV